MMLYRSQQKIQTIAYIFALILLFVSFLILISMQADQRQAIDRNYRTGLTNQTYLRAVDCKSSHTPTERTPELREWCYDQAEEATGVKVHRYGKD